MSTKPLNVCMVGHGMMGEWHSEGLVDDPLCCLHTLVGREPEATPAFARRFGYRKWTLELGDALRDPEVEAVILASPSELHEDMALACLEHGKPTLVEIPIAMHLAGAERVVAAARAHGVALGVVHPMRFRPERAEVLERVRAGEEHVRHTHGRFFVHRLRNVSAAGHVRLWTDNILWHHTTHLIDFGLWMAFGGDMRKVDAGIRKVSCYMPDVDPQTGIPMEIVLNVETHADQSIVATGSYYSRERIYDTLAITSRDSYRLDELRATLTTGAGETRIASERENAWLTSRDFVAAVRENREPLVPGWSVLPTMRVLQAAQGQWDEIHGRRVLPGRPVA
jgi:2-hydroxy-4-carboxymuconate semialdehyde hemiacetal dehydrogenase